MNSFEVHSLADCYNGSLIREFIFEKPVREDLILRLGDGKKFDYFPDLPKPYFRIEAAGKYIIRGVCGNTTMRVVLKQPNPEMNLFSLKTAVEDYCTGKVRERPRAPEKTARKLVPGGTDSKRFTAQWRLAYLTRRGSGA